MLKPYLKRIFEIMEVLGKETVVERLSNAISHIKSKKGT